MVVCFETIALLLYARSFMPTQRCTQRRKRLCFYWRDFSAKVLPKSRIVCGIWFDSFFSRSLFFPDMTPHFWAARESTHFFVRCSIYACEWCVVTWQFETIPRAMITAIANSIRQESYFSFAYLTIIFHSRDGNRRTQKHSKREKNQMMKIITRKGKIMWHPNWMHWTK